MMFPQEPKFDPSILKQAHQVRMNNGNVTKPAMKIDFPTSFSPAEANYDCPVQVSG